MTADRPLGASSRYAPTRSALGRSKSRRNPADSGGPSQLKTISRVSTS